MYVSFLNDVPLIATVFFDSGPILIENKKYM